MSYSFTVRASEKDGAKAAVREKIAEIADAQICHKRDADQVVAAAEAFIDLLTDDDSCDVIVNLNGSLTGQWTDGDVTRIQGASVSVSAGLDARTTG